MKKKYIDRLINREKQWPPCHCNKLVKLQLVEREKGEGYCANIQRGREDKTVKQTPLAYGDLFEVERGKKPVRKVLVEGDAGIGKTTLSIALSEDWAREKLFQEFKLLLLLPLREIEVTSAGSLPELLMLLHPSSDVCKAVASYVENNEEKVLIIADGWDELSDSDQQEGSFLYKLLFKRFPLMSVVVTSRPSASAPLHRLPCIDRFVEISGFSKEDIKEYIESEFTSDQEKASRLLEQLEDNPIVESVCSIPLNCSIMCHLWRTLEEDLPSTMTQLYTKIILNVILRNIQKKDAFKNVLRLSNFNDLPSDLHQSFRLLCEFAFQALDKNQIVFLKEELLHFFPKGLNLDAKILCFGLLQSAETVLETGHGVSFHFIHLTFMEYLAALHLVEHPQFTEHEVFNPKDNDPVNILIKFHRFSMVWRFFCGINYNFTSSKAVADNIVIKALKYARANINILFPTLFHFTSSKAVPDNIVIKALRYAGANIGNSFPTLFHCAFEAQNTLITNEVVQFYSENCSRRTRTAHDCAALLYIIAHIEECSDLKVNFTFSGVRDNQIRTLADILASKQGKLQVTCLYMSCNKLTGKCVSNTLHRVSPGYKSDTKLEPKSAKSVPSQCGLSELGISNDSHGVCGLQVLVNAIRDDLFSSLKVLALAESLTSDADTNDNWLTTLMDALSTCCPHLDSLQLSSNNLGVAGASAVAKGLSKLQHQSFVLYLSESSLGDDGLKAFVDNIERVYNFWHLSLTGNDIHAAGVSYLADAVSSGKISLYPGVNQHSNEYVKASGRILCSNNYQGFYFVKGDFCSYFSVLDISDNPLGLEGAEAVGRILCTYNCQCVDLSECKLTATSGDDLPNTDSLNVSDSICNKSVGQLLCRMPYNCTIECLFLNGNSFTGEGIHILSGLMRLCSCLEYLYCQDCGITSDDLILLLDKLTLLKSSSPSLCSKLGTWDLGNNAIDDRGVSSLIGRISSIFSNVEGYTLPPDIYLNNNPVSRERETKLIEEIKRVKDLKSQVKVRFCCSL